MKIDNIIRTLEVFIKANMYPKNNSLQYDLVMKFVCTMLNNTTVRSFFKTEVVVSNTKK